MAVSVGGFLSYIVALGGFLGCIIGVSVARVGVLVFTHCAPRNAFFYLYAPRFSRHFLSSAALIASHGDPPW